MHDLETIKKLNRERCERKKNAAKVLYTEIKKFGGRNVRIICEDLGGDEK